MNMATDIAYFDALYRADRDPWGVADRWYERRKRELLLAMLPRPRYQRAFEPACGTGDLTLALADRCDEVRASDASADAVGIASARLAHLHHVRVHREQLPLQWPNGRFDLIVISEWGYYLSVDEMAALARRCRGSLTDDGCLIACHWRHDFEERRQPTESVHAAFDAAGPLHRLGHHDERDFLMTLWSPCSQSPAQKEGLA